MGTRNVIIGGGRNDELMHCHMALADVFFTTKIKFFSRTDIMGSESRNEKNTKIIIQATKRGHGYINWSHLKDAVQKELN